MNKDTQEKAGELLRAWKGDRYAFGPGTVSAAGDYAIKYGGKALVVCGTYGSAGKWTETVKNKVIETLNAAGVSIIATEQGARPNSPREDVYRLALAIAKTNPSCIVAIGGGSTIDTCKAAAALAALACNDIEPLFGMNIVTGRLTEESAAMIPVIAVETASGSAAHLTKYANVTDSATGIKKLIIDDAIIPPAAVFDYTFTQSAPISLTLDGGLDGISHCWEVFMGATGKCYYDEIREIALTGISLIVDALPAAVENPGDPDSRIALGLGTDLGGYAIMIQKKNEATGAVEKGGTNGGHLGSFQLVSYLSHGRACALLNPYYTVLFANAIEPQNRDLATILKDAGLIAADISTLSGRDLALAVADGWFALCRKIGFPTSLRDAGVPESQIDVMISESKNPQNKSKLQNMPTPLDPDKGEVDSRMAPTLRAAFSGDISLVP